MAWIESHQGLARHPKLINLMHLTGYARDRCIGKLNLLWWWVLDYAEDGDLAGVRPETVGEVVDIRNTEEANVFYQALLETGFIDKETFCIHDWFDYAGRYLKTKYHSSNPAKYRQILRKHLGKPKGSLKAHIPKDKPTLTDHNLNQKTNDSRAFFDAFWAAYPKKRAKGQAEKAFRKIHPDEQLLAKMVASIERAKTLDDWRKQGGRYIPHPATWLEGRRWEDEFDEGGDDGGGNGRKRDGPPSKYPNDLGE